MYIQEYLKEYCASILYTSSSLIGGSYYRAVSKVEILTWAKEMRIFEKEFLIDLSGFHRGRWLLGKVVANQIQLIEELDDLEERLNKYG